MRHYFVFLLILTSLPIINCQYYEANKESTELEEFISNVTKNLNLPKELPTWLLAYYFSHEHLNKCKSSRNCDPEEVKLNMDEIRANIVQHLNRKRGQGSPQNRFETGDFNGEIENKRFEPIHQCCNTNGCGLQNSRSPGICCNNYGCGPELVSPLNYNEEFFEAQSGSAQSRASQQIYSPKNMFQINKITKPSATNQDQKLYITKAVSNEGNDYTSGYQNVYPNQPTQQSNTYYRDPNNRDDQNVQRFARMYSGSQLIPRPFGYTSDAQTTRHQKKSIYHSSDLEIFPGYRNEHFYVENYDVFIKCTEHEEICVLKEYCQHGVIINHALNFDNKDSPTEFCNIQTSICCHQPQPQPQPMVVQTTETTIPKPDTIINKISNASVKSINNNIIKYIFLGHNTSFTLKNESVPSHQIIKIHDRVSLTNGSMEQDLIDQASDFLQPEEIINSIVNATVDSLTNNIIKYIIYGQNVSIDNFRNDSIDRVISTSLKSDVSDELEFTLVRNQTVTSGQAIGGKINIGGVIQQKTDTDIRPMMRTTINPNLSQIGYSKVKVMTNTEASTTEQVDASSNQNIKITNNIVIVLPNTTEETTTMKTQTIATPKVVYLPVTTTTKKPFIIQANNQNVNVLSTTPKVSYLPPTTEKRITVKVKQNVYTTTPKVYLPPAKDFLPPFQIESKFKEISPEEEQDTEPPNRPVLQVNQCPMFMKCVLADYCDSEGFISSSKVDLTNPGAVSLLDCENKSNGAKGKCCRERESKLSKRLSQYVPENDGQYRKGPNDRW